MLLLWMLWPVLPSVVSNPDICAIGQNSSSFKVSPVLESLQCFNDYESYFHCMWKEERHSNTRLKLWLKTTSDSGSSQCKDYTSGMDGTSQCRYYIRVFSMGTSYIVFFNETPSLCSSVHNSPLNLSLLLRAQPPVDLTTFRTEDGDRMIRWSSPYPASSSLNSNITYKLSYRPHGDNWTTEELAATQKQLEKKKLIPGHRYEARVKARVSMGQWSHWTALVSWHSELDPEQAPRVDCVVLGEQKVNCIWEQSTELVHFISYQLFCRPNHAAPLTACCEDPDVSPSHRENVLRYSCLLTLTQPSALPLLELIPTRITKTFETSKSIRLPPPTQVNVKEQGHNWIVEWSPPNTSFSFFNYEVCYYSKQDEEDSVLLNLPKGSPSLTILGLDLLPSQSYKVKVRTLPELPYEGPLPDWSTPVEWTSHAAVWPISNWIYVAVAVIVALLFLVLYYSTFACRRLNVLWVESLPSPAKSKIISDIQAVNICKVMPSESTYICKILDVDRLSTCSSDAFFWLTISKGQEAVEADEGIWSCDNLPITPVDTSSVSFSGPYILCQSVGSKPVEDISDQTEVSCPDPGRPAPVNTVLFEEGYVCLPSQAVSRSMQDLTSQSQSSTSGQSNSSTEDEQHCVNEDHASELFWPQGGAILRSGYDFLSDEEDEQYFVTERLNAQRDTS